MNDNTSTSGAASGFVQSILDWAAHPFNSNGSALNWILFVGLGILAVWFWHVILLQIRQDI